MGGEGAQRHHCPSVGELRASADAALRWLRLCSPKPTQFAVCINWTFVTHVLVYSVCSNQEHVNFLAYVLESSPPKIILLEKAKEARGEEPASTAAGFRSSQQPQGSARIPERQRRSVPS